MKFTLFGLYHLKTVNEEVNIENEKKNSLYLNNITYVFSLKKDIASIQCKWKFENWSISAALEINTLESYQSSWKIQQGKFTSAR